MAAQPAIERLAPMPRHGHKVRAVLFDVDGTLYHQTPLRALMLPDLMWSAARDGGKTLRALATFRRVRERLRALGAPADRLERLQYSAPARELGCDVAWLESIVAEWMLRRPLGRLAYCRRRGLVTLLDALEARGIAAGAFSDYPTADKLDALGVHGRFSLEICALDADVNAFKPHPRGFLLACERWGLAPADVLYVGDRPRVDGAGAHGAGMQCAIVGPTSGFHQVLREILAHGEDG